MGCCTKQTKEKNVAGSLEGKRILVVDDDADIRTAIQTALAPTGAEMGEAADGNEAITAFTEQKPDLVVLDMGLPKRSGFLVLNHFKPDRKVGAKPYVVVVTGNAGKRHEVYARSLGVDEYITKPFRMERLVTAVEALLTRP
jgi:DNA-binding response OmpR family regulator